MLVKTEALIGRALDWMVAEATGKMLDGPFRPSRLREHGDPIVRDAKIAFALDSYESNGWRAVLHVPDEEPWQFYGPSRLVAGLRCVVAYCFGDTVDLPDNLISEDVIFAGMSGSC